MPLLTELVAFLRYGCYKDFAPTEPRMALAEAGRIGFFNSLLGYTPDDVISFGKRLRSD
jgi:hypothetical protein